MGHSRPQTRLLREYTARQAEADARNGSAALISPPPGERVEPPPVGKPSALPLRLETKSTAELWQGYATTGDQQYRNALAERYLVLVKRAVSRVQASLPDFIELDDLIGYGFIGLLEAIERYDPSQPTPFESYGLKRIQGAMIDGLRVMSWVPRMAVRKAQEVERAIENLHQKLQRAPTELEIAACLGLSEEGYYSLLKEISPITLLPMETLLARPLREEEDRAWEEVERRELQQLLARALTELPERERLVITLYYYEEMTLREITAVMKITEGRIHQIKTQALLRLRAIVQQMGYGAEGA